MAEPYGDINSYASLLDGVVSTLARGDVSADAAMWIRMTENELFRDCNVIEGDQKTTFTLSASATTLTLPDNCLDIQHVELDDDAQTVLKPVDLEKITAWRRNDNSGVPKFYKRYGNTLELAPGQGTSSETGTLFYYGKPAMLSEENQTNELAQLGWDAYLYGALRHSAPYLGDDPRIETWERFYNGDKMRGIMGAKESLRKAYWRARLSGPLQTHPDFEVNDQHAEY